MTSSQDANELPNAKEPATPILAAVAYPPHLLYVPPPLWGVLCGVSAICAILIGIVTGEGPRVDAAFAVFFPLFIWVAFKYRKDRHIWKRWSMKYVLGAPVPPYRGTVNLLSARLKGKNRFC